MPARLHCAGLLVALAAALPAQAQQKYEIKLKNSVQGLADLGHFTETEDTTLIPVDADGKATGDPIKIRKSTTVVSRKHYLEQAAGAYWAKRIQVTYERAEETVNGLTKPLPLHGLTAVVERTDKEYRFRDAQGKELPVEVVQALKGKFTFRKDDEKPSDDLILPGRPVAIGETWAVDKALLLRGFKPGEDGPQPDQDNLKATAKLVKVYQKDGHRFGVMHMTVVMPIKEYRVKGKVEKAGKGDGFSLNAVMDRCIDGSVTDGTDTGSMKIVMLHVQPDQSRLRIASAKQMTESHREVDPKEKPNIVKDLPVKPAPPGKYNFQIKRPAQGDSALVQRTLQELNDGKMIDKNGTELQIPNLESKTYKFVYRETILEQLPGATTPTKLKRVYTQAEAAEPGRKMKPLPIQGKTVLIEKKDGKYRYQIEGSAELTGKDAAALEKSFSQSGDLRELMDLLLPTEPLGVGGTWQAGDTVKQVAQGMGMAGMEVDPKSLKFTGKLVKAYRKDGRQYGVLTMEIVMAPRVLPLGGGKIMKLEPGAKLVIGLDLDVCIDGSAALGTVTQRMELSLIGPVPGAEMRMRVNTRNATTETRTALPKP